MLILRTLNTNDEKAFLDGAKEWPLDDISWYSFIWTPGMDFKEMLITLEHESKGLNLLKNRVQHTMLYAFLDSKIIGRLSVRHYLNDFLKHRGGNIGYSVAPKFRNKGYATEIVRQGLAFCRSIPIDPMLITCSDNNSASKKIIEKFGGQLENKIWLEDNKEFVCRYWLSNY